jgi:hypothetical protein
MDNTTWPAEATPSSIGVSEGQLTLQEIKRRYHNYLGQLTSTALDRKARAGECVGFAPTGYVNVHEGGEAWVEIDPKLGPLVQEAFLLAGRRGSSLRKVLGELTPKGLVSRNGKAMSPAALRHILRNPFYVGMIRYKRAFYQGNHPPLVTPSCFDRVQRRLRQRSRAG